jgi:hypothetical protein
MQTPITIVKTFDLIDCFEVELCPSDKDDNSRETCIKIDGTILEIVLFGFKTFNDDAERLNYDAEDNFKNFPRILYEGALSSWQNIYDPIAPGTDLDDDLFQECLTKWLATFFTQNHRRALLAYIGTSGLAMKPRQMSCQAFWTRMEILQTYASMMPGITPLLSQGLLRVAFVSHLPKAWGEEWTLHHGDPSDVIYHPAFILYFETKRTFSDRQTIGRLNNSTRRNRGNNNNPSNGNNRRSERNNDGRGRGNNQRNGGRNNGGRNNGGRYNGGRNTNDQRRPRNDDNFQSRNTRARTLTNADPCPLPNHYHTWGLCRQNPDGTSYNPRRSNDDNQQGRGRQNGRGRVHFNTSGRNPHGGAHNSHHNEANNNRNLRNPADGRRTQTDLRYGGWGSFPQDGASPPATEHGQPGSHFTTGPEIDTAVLSSFSDSAHFDADCITLILSVTYKLNRAHLSLFYRILS